MRVGYDAFVKYVCSLKLSNLVVSLLFEKHKIQSENSIEIVYCIYGHLWTLLMDIHILNNVENV